MNSTDIAKLAGVARSTVSKVLNNYPDIPLSTKEKVLQIIAEQGYKPVKRISKKAKKAAKVVAVYFFVRLNRGMFERINSHYDSSLLKCLAMEAKSRGYSLMYEILTPEDTNEKIVKEVCDAFTNCRISAAVFVGLDDDTTFLQAISGRGRHIIVLDKLVDTSSGIRCLFSNDFNSAIRACEHLFENGFRNIMHLSGDLIKLSGKNRRDGYLEAYKNLKRLHGIKEPAKVLEGGFNIESGYNAGRTFVEEKLYEHYNGIMCGCDMIAIGFIKYIREHKPELIDQIGIIGFDNENVDLYITPALSTMAPDYRNFARFIMDMEQYYDQSQAGIAIKIEHTLIERDSSRAINQRLYHDIPLEEFAESFE